MPKISVIVPVYKVAKYLEKCVESILAQTYTDLEVILVDDGSPDECGNICDRLAQKDSRIKVLHKQNGGLSSARNAGVSIAKGKYIGFIDGDDYIAPEMYEKLYSTLIENNADISICNYVYVDEHTGCVDQEKKALSPIVDAVLSSEEAYEKLEVSKGDYSFYVTAWNKLYKHELFENCLFSEGRIHEDEFIMHHLFDKSERIVTVSDFLYYYVQRKGSITNTNLSIKTMDAVYAWYDRYLFYVQKGRWDLADLMLNGIYWRITTLVPYLKKDSKEIVHSVMQMVLPSFMKRKVVLTVRLLFVWYRYWWKTK